MFFVVISGVLMPLIEGEMVQSLLTRIELNQRTGTSLGGRSDYERHDKQVLALLVVQYETSRVKRNAHEVGGVQERRFSGYARLS